MGLCFFLVCTWYDSRFFIERLLEFFCSYVCFDNCVYSLLSMLKRIVVVGIE